MDLQESKGRDYQNPHSTVRQADYYPRGIMSLFDMIHQKERRLCSLLEAAEHDPAIVPKHEAIEDTLKDLINYASFAVSWLRKGIDGQPPGRDMFNRISPEAIRTDLGKTMSDWPMPAMVPGVSGPVKTVLDKASDHAMVPRYTTEVDPAGKHF